MKKRHSLPDPNPEPEPSQVPPPAVRKVLIVAVSVHLFALFVSFSTLQNVSGLQAALGQTFRIYLQPTHFSADERPVYLTHATPLEQPHVLQRSNQAVARIEDSAEVSWSPALPAVSGGLADSDRRARFLSTLAMLADQDQAGLVAELLLPIATEDPDSKMIRIVRLPTDLSELNAEAEAIYVARIIRDKQRIALVQLESSRLSAVANSSFADPNPLDSELETSDE